MIKIATERGYNGGFSRQVVFEWEDDFAKTLDTSLYFLDSYKKHPIARLYRKAGFKKKIDWAEGHDICIYIATNIDLLRITAWYLPNFIPVMLDVNLNEIDELVYLTQRLPLYYVTSYQIYKKIATKYPDNKVKYIPQSVSEIYSAYNGNNKGREIIQFGRNNPVLHNFALKYCDRHEGIKYKFRNPDGYNMVEYSNGIFKDVGIITHRQSFIAMLRGASISLCSTPLADRTRDFGEGIDFFTARWYESVACGCGIIARWTDLVKEELLITDMTKVAHNVSDYGEFEFWADKIMNGEEDSESRKLFLSRNNSRCRANEIYMDLKALGYR